MRILVLGASGFIGSALCARLATSGHHVVGLGRRHHASALNNFRWVQLDISRATAVDDWAPVLRDIDAVVNCAGVLQDSPADSTYGVHVAGMRALYHACEKLQLRRVLHVSAVGIDRHAATAFSKTKLAGDQELMARDLDWVILRPSVVVGRSAYGGSALLRGLAALPMYPVLPGTGELQLVTLDDLVETIVFFLQPQAPTRMILEVVGPRRWHFDEVVQLYRRWLGWRKAQTFRIPPLLGSLLYRAGDAIALLGWRPPIRSTARKEVRFGAVGDAASWTKVTGIVPRDVEQSLASEPASVQERWYAGLYILKPLLFGIFSAFWIATGFISLGPGWHIGMSLLREAGVGESVATAAVISGALADILIGLAILYRPTSRYGLYAALLISLTYAIIGTILVPRLWEDPLGPMLKIWPIMVLNLVALAILEDR